MSIVKDLEFKGSWRSYQQRVLNELGSHLEDKKLNVVAAPGAGKTTLGIEVMARLGHSAFILAPTITIRNQWKQRILEGFLPDDYDKTKISTDIRAIKEITVSTYQALHTIYKNAEEREKFLSALKKNKVKTLVLDESHHLRTEWYITLTKLCETLESDDFTTVSLTGTPPYDVSPEEWNNYHTLCGPVDTEISIPELVKNGDLCPHQDLIYFSDLSVEEEKTVYDFEKNRAAFFRYIKTNADFQHAVEMSKFVEEHPLDVIFNNTGFTISIISYLLSADSLSISAKIMMEFLELDLNMIPSFDYDIAKTMIDGILGQFEQYFENAHVIKNKLKELKLLRGNKVDLKGEVDFKKLFARSVNKLEAINEITKLEYSIQKRSLREVVLLDYIGKGDSIGLNIFSVFDKLYEQKIPLGILTGTLIVIPKEIKEDLYKILNERKINTQKVLTADFKENYLRVETFGEVNIVSIITELFEKGKINILIGTAALLGEGWDSPCINSLIIASVVGSFMLSNQMRGRALRIDKNNPEKTANIWHLASLTHNEGIESPDYQTIIKRFNTFEGISYKNNVIQNGIARMGKQFEYFEGTDCKKLNEKMFEFAKQKGDLKNKWEQIFNKSKITEKNMTPQVYEIVETDVLLPEVSENINLMQKFVNDFMNRKKINYTEIEQKYIAKCILKTLWDIDIIKTNYKDIKIETNVNNNGNFSLTPVGCTNSERNIFVKSFCEVFSFDDNARYILKIKKKIKEKNIEKEEIKYLPVPEAIGTQQKFVKIFVDNLKGKNEIYNINKNSKENLALYDSYLKPASKGHLHIIFDKKNNGQKLNFNLNLKEIRLLLKYNLKLCYISDKTRNKIEIGTLKENKDDILVTFFNCSNYERNLIINNLCEMYSPFLDLEENLKVKGEDDIIYFKLPKLIKLNYKQRYHIYCEHFCNFLIDEAQPNETQAIYSVIRNYLFFFILIGFFWWADICGSQIIQTLLDLLCNIGKTIQASYIFIGIFSIIISCILVITETIKYNINHYKSLKKRYLSKNTQIEMIYTRSEKNKLEILKAKYNAWLKADIKRSRKWM